MTQVVALRARGRQDGGVRDRRDMVAIHGTCQRCAHGNQEQRIALVEHTDDDGQDQRDGAPARAHGEADEAGHQEDDARQNGQAHAQAVQEAAHEVARAEHVTAATAQAPCQHQDHDGADH